jgi:hypothetical protein
LGDGSELGDQEKPEVPPDMGAGADLDDDEEEGELAGGAGPETGAPLDPDLAALYREKGFKSPAELRNFVKNLEKSNTELGQENRTLRLATSFPPPAQVQAPVRTERKVLQIPEDPSELFTDREKFVGFIKQADEVSRANARADFQEEQDKREYAKMYQKAVKKAAQNPEEFERLRPRMVRLSQTPGWTDADLDDIYNRAKEEEIEEKRRHVEEVQAGLGLTTEDLDRIRAILGKTRTGQISTAGGGGIPGTGIPSTEEERKKAIRDEILGAKAGE